MRKQKLNELHQSMYKYLTSEHCTALYRYSSRALLNSETWECAMNGALTSY